MTEVKNGNFVYEVFLQNQAEDDMGFYYCIITLDHPINDLSEIKQMSGYYTFNKKVLTYFVENNKTRFIDKAKELKAEVFGEEYTESTEYRPGEPWESIDEAIKIAKKEISISNAKKH